MTELHTHELVWEYQPNRQYSENVYRFRVPGGWMYIYSVAKAGWFGKKQWVTSVFAPDPESG
jgi:hypothetical protein